MRSRLGLRKLRYVGFLTVLVCLSARGEDLRTDIIARPKPLVASKDVIRNAGFSLDCFKQQSKLLIRMMYDSGYLPHHSYFISTESFASIRKLLPEGARLKATSYTKRHRRGERLLVRRSRFPGALDEFEVSRLHPRSRLLKELESVLGVTLGVYRNRGTVPAEAIAGLGRLERELAPDRVAWHVLTDGSGKAKMTLRVFDGSSVVYTHDLQRVELGRGWMDAEKTVPHVWMKRFDPIPIKNVSPDRRLPLQITHPDLVLPEEEFRFEIGRGAKVEEMLFSRNAGAAERDLRYSLHNLLNEAFGPSAWGLWPQSSPVYAEATDVLAAHYVKEHGFEIIAGTLPRDELLASRIAAGLPPEAVPGTYQTLAPPADGSKRFVLRATMRDLHQVAVNKMYTPDFDVWKYLRGIRATQ